MINLLVRRSPDVQLNAHLPLSKDRVQSSNGHVDQCLRHMLSYFRESPFDQVLTVFLILTLTDAVLRRSSHFHVPLFLFLDGATCVRLSRVPMKLCLFCSSVLQLVARDAQRASIDSGESAQRPWNISTRYRRVRKFGRG